VRDCASLFRTYVCDGMSKFLIQPDQQIVAFSLIQLHFNTKAIKHPQQFYNFHLFFLLHENIQERNRCDILNDRARIKYMYEEKSE